MIHETPFTITKISSSDTEDGDIIVCYEVRVQDEAGKVSYNKNSKWYISVWEDAGEGWFKGTYNIMIDATEVAIEQANDRACWRARAEDDAHGWW